MLFKDSPISINYKANDYKFIVVDSMLYLSLLDICRMLNAKSKWDYDNSYISLYLDKDKYENYTRPIGKIALIRFEDVTAGEEYLDSENLEKFRIVEIICFQWRSISYSMDTKVCGSSKRN